MGNLDIVGDTTQSNLIIDVIKLTDSLFSEGKIIEAIEEFQRFEAIIKMSDFPNPLKSVFYAHYGKLLVNNIFMNSYPAAEAIKIIELANQLSDYKDPFTKSLIIDQLGLAHYYDNLTKEDPKFTKEDPKYTIAENLFDEALNIRRDSGNERLMSESYFHLGLIYERTERVDKALDYYHTAHDLAKQVDAKLEQSFAIRHIGFIHGSNEEPEDGIKCLEDSLRLRLEIGFKISLPFSYTSLGDAYYAKNEHKLAIENYTAGYQISKEINNKRGIMLSSYSIGRTLNSIQDFSQAKKYLEEAKLLAIEINYEVAIDLINEQLRIK